jgi:DNA polymerase III epsilon subunit-like protein
MTHPNIQLAAIAVDQNYNELASFERKIQFDEATTQPEALRINHYSREVWEKEAKPVPVVCREFADFLRPYCCVTKISKAGKSYRVARLFGHNAATFDAPRIQAMFRSTGVFLPADMRVRCTLQRALWWFDEHGQDPKGIELGSSLTTLCEYFGIPILDAHDALGDVRMTVALAKVLAKDGRKGDTK